MRLPFRGALPADVRSGLRLERGERVLAHAEAEEGTLVATTLALHLPDGHRVPWQRVDRARWADGGLVLTEEGVGERGYSVPRPGRLAEAVAERVTASIVVSRHVALEGAPGGDSERGFRLVARRPPGGSDITWQVHIDEGVDPEDPRLNEEATRALTALRDRMGI